MKAQLVNENIEFKKGKTPKEALTLGEKAQLLDKIENDEDWLEDQISALETKTNGAFGMYLPLDDQKVLLAEILVNKREIEVKGDDLHDYIRTHNMDQRSFRSDKEAKEYFFEKEIYPLTDKGWEIYSVEENYDLLEVILLK